MGDVTLERLLRGCRVVAHRGDLSMLVSGVEHDSRKVRPGDVFFALDGARTRGLDHALEAVRRGAVAVVASELLGAAAHGGAGVTTVAVDDVRRALALAACEVAGHPTRRVPTVGITGTNGKTTITYMLEAMCAAAERPAGVIGTINVRLGGVATVSGYTTPEAPVLQALAADLVARGARVLVMEVTSHGIAMRRSHGIGFRVVAFTNLTQDHLDLHGSMERYGSTKLRLFTDELEHSPDAVAVVNVDDAFGERVAREARCPAVRVSAAGTSGTDVRVVARHLSVDGTEATLEVRGRRIEVRCPQIGEHNLANMVVAVGIGDALGLPDGAIVEGLAGLSVVPGRLERVPDPRGTAVLVDYAHTPDALTKVTQTLAQFTRGRLVVLFGCGGDRDPLKRPLMGEAAARGGDLVVVTSDNPRSEDPRAIIDMALPGLIATGIARLTLADLGAAAKGYVVEPDRRTAIRAAVAAARQDDVVLIAGKGHEPYQILKAETIHFDDREEARDAIRAAIEARKEGVSSK
jgi:UDP-N-acetylmuramoyl-L-alanyl-D-glutamate--2,6-diaminopimelate ligase